jgi:hypothetical protein
MNWGNESASLDAAVAANQLLRISYQKKINFNQTPLFCPGRVLNGL